MPHKTAADKAAYMKDWRTRKIAAGLCGTCGVEPKREGMRDCTGCGAARVASGRRSEAKARDEIYLRYGGPRCVCCGETELLFLTLDHVDNDGGSHRREIVGKNGGCSYRQLRSSLRRRGWPPILQVLCFNCNMGRQRNGGVCPHVRQRQP